MACDWGEIHVVVWHLAEPPPRFAPPPGVGRAGIWLKQDYARVSSKLTIHSFFFSRLILIDVWNPYYGWICSRILKAYQTILYGYARISLLMGVFSQSQSQLCKVFWIPPNLANMNLICQKKGHVPPRALKISRFSCLVSNMSLPARASPKLLQVKMPPLTTGGLGKSFLWPSKQHPADLCNVFDVKIVSIKCQMSQIQFRILCLHIPGLQREECGGNLHSGTSCSPCTATQSRLQSLYHE